MLAVLRRPVESAQYMSIKYTERLAGDGIDPTVGSVCDSYDIALAETINGLDRAEVIHRRGPWRSFEAVEYATLEWVDWFNNRRLLEPSPHRSGWIAGVSDAIPIDRLDINIRSPCYGWIAAPKRETRSEEHTSELQSLMRISYAVFCLKKKN